MTARPSAAYSLSPEMSKAKRILAYIGVITAVFTTMIDTMAANMVLPTVTAEWNVTAASAAWIVSIYQLVLVCCLLPAAAMSARFGVSKTYLFGLGLLLCTSSLATWAPNLEVLVFARGLQGLAAACLMSVNLALIRLIVSPKWLGRALGLNLTISAIGTTLGPTIAGLLISFASWHLVFAISIPTTLLSLAFSLITLKSLSGSKVPLNLGGIFLSVLSVGTLLSGLNGISQGWAAWLVASLIAAGLVLSAVFVRVSLTQSRPILPVTLFRDATFSLSLTITNLTFTAQMIIFVSLPFFLQIQLGMSPHEAGLIFSLWPIAIACVAGITGVLADRLPPEVICTFGLVILCAGILAISPFGGRPDQVQMAVALLISGVGFGLYQVPNNSILLASVPASRGAEAGSTLAISRLLGQAVGVVLGTWAVSALAPTSPFLLAALFVAGALAMSCVRLWRRPRGAS